MIPMLAYPLAKPMFRPFSHFGRRIVTALIRTKFNIVGFVFHLPKMIFTMAGNILKQVRYAAVRNNVTPKAVFRVKRSIIKGDAVNIPSAPIQTSATKAVPGLGAAAKLGLDGQKVIDSSTSDTTVISTETGSNTYDAVLSGGISSNTPYYAANTMATY